MRLHENSNGQATIRLFGESNLVNEAEDRRSARVDQRKGVVMARLLVADDHAPMREKVVATLEVEHTVVAAVADGHEVLEAESRFKPEVVVLDISMPNMNGIDAATQLKQRDSSVKIIFLTVHEEHAFLNAALATGALGYVIKGRLATDLPLAVTEVMAGRRFVSPSIASVLREAP